MAFGSRHSVVNSLVFRGTSQPTAFLLGWLGYENFRDLEVWNLAHNLTPQTYRATKGFPADETFGLTSQIRRSAASVPANIAEGCGRRGNAEFHRFLQMAMGSASELEYHLLLAKDLEYLEPDAHEPLHQTTTRVKRMLASLINKVDEARQRARSAEP